MTASVEREPSDEELLVALGRGESDALDALYDRHHRLALALATRMLRSREAAEDVVQEVFLATWRQAARYRAERGSVKTWLLAMVHHRSIDRLRRRSSGETAELGEWVGTNFERKYLAEGRTIYSCSARKITDLPPQPAI